MTGSSFKDEIKENETIEIPKRNSFQLSQDDIQRIKKHDKTSLDINRLSIQAQRLVETPVWISNWLEIQRRKNEINDSTKN